MKYYLIIAIALLSSLKLLGNCQCASCNCASGDVSSCQCSSCQCVAKPAAAPEANSNSEQKEVSEDSEDVSEGS